MDEHDVDALSNFDNSLRSLFTTKPSRLQSSKNNSNIKSKASLKRDTNLNKGRQNSEDLCGWTSFTNHKVFPTNNRPHTTPTSTHATTANYYRRSNAMEAINERPRTNLHDRYTSNSEPSSSENFQFFHYNDIKLYMKQYRSNHVCGHGERPHNLRGKC